MSRKEAPIYIFNLKNNLSNKLFLRWFKKKLNTDRYSVVCRGRHPDRKSLYEKHGWKYTARTQNEVPLKYAKTFGVYVRDKLTHFKIGSGLY